MRKGCFLGLLLLLSSCNGKTTEKKELPPVPVSIAKAVQKTVPYVVKTIGNTQAFASVDIRPQVSGELTGYFFIDGQDVEPGDLLFTIDTRPYEAALEEAEGQFEQAKASLLYNEQKVERYKQLLPDDFVSILDYEQYVAEAISSAGEVQQYDGAVKNAKVNLNYCTIASPLEGRCGRHLVDPGNIVQTDQEQTLVTINQISPLYAMLTVPERYFPEIKRYQSQTKEGLDVVINVVGEKNKVQGRLDFLNNTVDTNTGTVLLRAIFSNEDKALWPGQFLHAQINLYEIPGAILIPAQSIKRDTKGPYVFVCKSDQTVTKQAVELGQQLDTEQVVMKGLKDGDCVVTDGQINLYEGAKIKVKEKAS